MIDSLESLAAMDYPGRFIAMGQNPVGNNVVVYGITGRSPSSQARRLVNERLIKGKFSADFIGIEVTDEKVLAQGDPSLLVYPAIIINQKGIAVSNGAQTQDIANTLINSSSNNPANFLRLEKWSYEPDEPNFTPRINGVMDYSHSFTPTLGIIKRNSRGETDRFYFEVPQDPSHGIFISTYKGANVNPLPSFDTLPRDIRINDLKPEDIAKSFYDSLNPDFRVSVAAVVVEKDGYKKAIVNRHN